MSKIAISVESLGKQFRVGTATGSYSTLREKLVDLVGAPFYRLASLLRRNRQDAGTGDDILWALKDVSFQINCGEVVGIIGRNGAGKSTLLKILSQITEPSEGHADMFGRVGSLLEVGTGFHPELTGRENVFLNGAILGMSRSEIERKFDEIVAFAEVKRFIDTPVKHYSSGMCVRLAFAVAAHLEPEILIIDEVLAVGDASFQKKCLGKMEGVAKEGRTVLFVSHNMLAVQNLCSRVIWLHDGKIVQDGKPADVVSSYLRMSASMLTEQAWDDVTQAPGNHKVRLRKISVRGADRDRPDQLSIDQPCEIEVEYWNQRPQAVLHATLHVYTEQGILAFTTGSAEQAAMEDGAMPAGLFRSVCHLPANLLNTGVHRIVLLIVENRSRVTYRLEDALSFEMVELSKRHFGWQGREPGAVRPMLRWTTIQVQAGEPVNMTPLPH
ncbi:MAG: ABC transporter ATP-binding protein [Nitrospira sp.]|nr:ABC transporter ATP-binding protein [Nitrospira sp.]